MLNVVEEDRLHVKFNVIAESFPSFGVALDRRFSDDEA